MAKVNRLTLLIVPEHGGKTFEVKFPRFLARLFPLLLMLMGILLLLGLRAHWLAGSRAEELVRLEREKALLLEEVAQIKELERVLQRLQASNRKLYTVLHESLGMEGGESRLQHPYKGKSVYITGIERMRWGRLVSLPAMWPAKGTLGRRFGDGFPGVEISMRWGQLVRASGAGQVTAIRYDERWGRLLTIDHGNGIMSRYGYTSRIFVKQGEYVQQGQPVALSGYSGAAPGAALFFAVLEAGVPHDPLAYRLWL